MNNISIEIYHKKFQKQVILLILEIQRTEFGIDITPEQQPDLNEITHFYQKENGNFWVAVDAGVVIGTIALLDIGNHEGALRKMFVRKNSRGTGVAKQLLETLLSWAKNHQMQAIYLGTTPAFLAAHRFYEKNGFIEIQKETLPKTFPIMEVDKKFYKKVLR